MMITRSPSLRSVGAPMFRSGLAGLIGVAMAQPFVACNSSDRPPDPKPPNEIIKPSMLDAMALDDGDKSG